MKFIKWMIVMCVVFSAKSNAQNFSNLKTYNEPLVLESVGSFYVGGNSEQQTRVQIGGFFPDGNITVNQTYVSYMVPYMRQSNLSVVMIHGMNLSGKTYETTPSGTMGWNEYFVRKGFPVYIIDQVGVGRSGFNQKTYNDVKGRNQSPENQPSIIRISDENTSVNFRFTTFDGKQVENGKFPLVYFSEFSKQSIPFMSGAVPRPNPTHKNLAELAKELKNTVLISHSQSGSFPLDAALIDMSGIKAMVLLEPGGTGNQYTKEQLEKIKNIPLLVVYGDHLKNDTGVSGHSWNNYYEGWRNFVGKFNELGGNAKMIHLKDIGIKGNSHMLMMDVNNQEIANLIIDWVNQIK
ncbi:hypothetical protein [Joostella sp. CR20]|uniref:hypothetical protein n=1 Tax=Joostella sp. CR20 TaxID=2804312 RepID=UPI00313EFBC1